MVKVSDLVAEFLKEKGIDVVFGIIGSANSHIFDSINKLGFTKIINTHHEQSAVLAMGAYYRASGKLSAALVTAGGAASNAVTGVVSNWADSIPGLIISGQESSNYIREYSKRRMFGTQGFDIVNMVSKVTKYSVQLDEHSDIQNELEKAFNESITGRPGPCWIDMPFNIQSKLVKINEWKKNTNRKKIIYVDDILEEIKNSKRPVVLGGHGIKLSNSKNIFNKFVETFKIPTLLSWSGIDILSNDNSYYYGRFGLYGQRAANFIIQNSDLVIVFGSRLAIPQVGYDFSQFARDAKIILIDVDASEADKSKRIYHVQEDCGDVLSTLMIDSNKINGERVEWINYCDKILNEFPLIEENHVDNGYINSYKFIDKMSDYLKDNHVIITDMGTALLSGHQAIKLKENQVMFTSLGLGEMGYGLPGALGAAIACPNKPILCMNCDGGMMMNLQEAHTIIENNLPVKIIIFNNDGYLMIKHTQKMLFNGNYVNVDKKSGVGLPDFSKLMPAFGYEYYSLKSWDDFDEKMNLFFNNPSAAVLEVFMDPEQDFIPKVKGVLKEDLTILAPPIEEMSPILPIEKIKQSMLIELSEKSKQIKR
jgi:acetolactate synthase-1/2/3 large subunit